MFGLKLNKYMSNFQPLVVENLNELIYQDRTCLTSEQECRRIAENKLFAL